MQNRLPVWVDPRTLSPGQTLSGSVSAAEFDQLGGIVLNPDVSIAVSLEVAQGGVARLHLSGRIHAQLQLMCQRCLAPMDWALDREMAVALVRSDDEAARLPDDVEPWLLQDGRLLLRELVAEELLLALPFAPRHESCGAAQAAETEE